MKVTFHDWLLREIANKVKNRYLSDFFRFYGNGNILPKSLKKEDF